MRLQISRLIRALRFLESLIELDHAIGTRHFAPRGLNIVDRPLFKSDLRHVRNVQRLRAPLIKLILRALHIPNFSVPVAIMIDAVGKHDEAAHWDVPLITERRDALR